MLRKRLKLIGSTLRSRSDKYKAALVIDFVRDCGALLGLPDGTGAAAAAASAVVVKPIVDSVYAFADVEQAHARMQANLNVGKIVLSLL